VPRKQIIEVQPGQAGNRMLGHLRIPGRNRRRRPQPPGIVANRIAAQHGPVGRMQEAHLTRRMPRQVNGAHPLNGLTGSQLAGDGQPRAWWPQEISTNRVGQVAGWKLTVLKLPG